MTPLLLATALAAPAPSEPPPEVAAALVGLAVAPTPRVTGGVLDGDHVWMGVGADCVPMGLVDERGARVVAWDACPAGPVTCTWTKALVETWHHSSSFECTRPDDSGWGGGSGGSMHDVVPLVRHDAEAAEWSRVFSLRADFGTHTRSERPCTEASAAHGEPSSRGPVRRCDTSEGVHISRVNPYGGGGIGVGVGFSTEPVDCTVPCPENPDLARVQAANAWLGERRFFEVAAPRHGVYASEALCRAAPTPAPFSLPEDLCTPPEPAAER